MTTAAPPRTFAFVARSENQRLTIEPAQNPQLDPLNRLVVPRSDGEHVQFTNNRANIHADTVTDRCEVCNANGTIIKDGAMHTCPKCSGEGSYTVEITRCNGERINRTVDEVLTFLREHSLFNMSAPGGFWEEGAAPDEPKPTLAEQMKAVSAATAFSDLEQLAAIRTVEESTHKRVAVLQAIEVAEQAIALRDAPDTDLLDESGESGEPDASGSNAPEDDDLGGEPAS